MSGQVVLSYEMLEELTLFAAFRNRFEGFHRNDDDRHRRLFLRQRRLEAGLSWRPCAAAEFTFAGGYAFDQELERGFDVRDTDKVREFSDEPYIRVGFNVAF